ncbi:MAG: hypothetical protein ACSLFI_03180 [Solirubrobacterales bacterium]
MDELRLENLLADVLQPIEPPERMSTRLQSTFAAISEAAATDLSDWADELTESEMQSLREPRNWVRPVVAVAAGGIATGALVVFEFRRRGRQRSSRFDTLVKDARSRTGL